jgi:hypothetical protein
VDLLLYKLDRLHIFVLLMCNNPEKPIQHLRKTDQIILENPLKIRPAENQTKKSKPRKSHQTSPVSRNQMSRPVKPNQTNPNPLKPTF